MGAAQNFQAIFEFKEREELLQAFELARKECSEDSFIIDEWLSRQPGKIVVIEEKVYQSATNYGDWSLIFATLAEKASRGYAVTVYGVGSSDLQVEVLRSIDLPCH